jgi:hypothetical protein
MRAAGEVVDLHRPGAVGERAPVAHPFHEGLPSRLGLAIRGHRRRRGQSLLEESARGFVRDHGDPVGGHGAEATRVIEVMVTVDHVADGLPRHQLARLGEHRHRALFIERALDRSASLTA